MTRVQYTVNGLALLALAVGLAVYDIRTRPRRCWTHQSPGSDPLA